jgi:hypothetical protein
MIFLGIFDVVFCFLAFDRPLLSTIQLPWVFPRNCQTNFPKRSAFIARRRRIIWIEPVNRMSLGYYDSVPLVSSSAVDGDVTVPDGCQPQDINVSGSQDVLQLLYH